MYRQGPPKQRQAPRRRRKPQQDNSQNKGKGKGKGGKGGKASMEPPPWSSPAPATSTAAPSTTPSKAEQKLQEIVNALKKRDDPELQNLAKEADVLYSKTATSKLHRAVTKHGDAKTALLEARQARSNLHASWKQYLETAIATWETYITDFDKEDQRLEAVIEQSLTSLATAQETLDEAKKAATEEELKDEVEMIEDEDEGLDRTYKSGQAMRAGLQGMKEGLQKLRTQTDEAIEMSGSKRQRVEGGASNPKPSALEPFGGAGR